MTNLGIFYYKKLLKRVKIHFGIWYQWTCDIVIMAVGMNHICCHIYLYCSTEVHINVPHFRYRLTCEGHRPVQWSLPEGNANIGDRLVLVVVKTN